MAKTLTIPDQCPMDIGLNILTGRWRLRILWKLSEKAVRLAVRFNELQRLLDGIAAKALAQQSGLSLNHSVAGELILPSYLAIPLRFHRRKQGRAHLSDSNLITH